MVNEIEPLLVSIADAAKITGESEWQVKQNLRSGAYRARKRGRRTLIEFLSIKQNIGSLTVATFAPPVDRKKKSALSDAAVAG